MDEWEIHLVNELEEWTLCTHFLSEEPLSES